MTSIKVTAICCSILYIIVPMIKQGGEKHIAFGQMNNEWNRFSSFSTFPPESKAMPLRLAQAGFFYSGFDEEAICFYCGLKNNIWRDDEAVINAHKRLSPQCGFICGKDTNNIAINGHKTLTSETRIDSKTKNVLKNYSQAKNRIMQSGEIVFNHLSRKENDMVKTSLTDRQLQLYPGVCSEKPRHPDYMLENIRLSSFAKWPATSSVSIRPDDLARAGFFYAGMFNVV